MSITAMGGPWSSRPCADLELCRFRFRSATVHPASQAARLRLFERFSAARQARIGHKILMCIKRLFAGSDLDASRRPVRQEFPTLFIVLEIRGHDLVENL